MFIVLSVSGLEFKFSCFHKQCANYLDVIQGTGGETQPLPLGVCEERQNIPGKFSEISQSLVCPIRIIYIKLTLISIKLTLVEIIAGNGNG